MIKMKKIISISALALGLLLAGCGGTQGQQNSFDPTSGFNGGNKALTFSFEENAPPSVVRDQGSYPFQVRFLIKNEGEFDIPENSGYVSLVGVDKNILNLQETSKVIPALNGYKVQGGNVIEGRQQFVLFSDLKYMETIAGSSQTLNLNANICYPYETKASSSLCINGNTNIAIDDTLKICDLDSDRQVGYSGGPLSIENFKQYVSGTSSITFQFDIVHTPTSTYGTLYESNTIDSDCKIQGNNPTSSEANAKKDVVTYEVETGISGLNCESKGTNTNTVTLYSNKYQVVCTQDTTNQEEYEKAIAITLNYDYLDRISKSITVEHIQR